MRGNRAASAKGDRMGLETWEGPAKQRNRGLTGGNPVSGQWDGASPQPVLQRGLGTLGHLQTQDEEQRDQPPQAPCVHTLGQKHQLFVTRMVSPLPSHGPSDGHPGLVLKLHVGGAQALGAGAVA